MTIFTSLRVIIEAGKVHGAHPEDIYGCLYFFISEQLHMFAQRLRDFKIRFKIFPLDATQLSQWMRQNVFAEYGVPASIRFDRIAVSNILDVNYIGLRGVLTHWAPLLAENNKAAIVGYFMNWFARQEDGRVAGASPFVVENIMKGMMDKMNVKGMVDKMKVRKRPINFRKIISYILMKVKPNNKPNFGTMVLLSTITDD